MTLGPREELPPLAGVLARGALPLAALGLFGLCTSCASLSAPWSSSAPLPNDPARVIPAGAAPAPSVDLLAEPVQPPQIDQAAVDPAEIVEREGEKGRAGCYVFRWPLESVSISSPYGARKNPFARRRRGGRTSWHGGLDLNGKTGDQVLAAAPGRVVHAGWYYGYGKHVAIEHPGGFLTRYGHLSEITVFVGQRVRAGAPIGLVGSTGRSTGPHLHFTLEKDKKSVDPLVYIGRPLEELDVAQAAKERVAAAEKTDAEVPIADEPDDLEP